MYIVGTFSRRYFLHEENPLEEVKVVENIEKQHLINARNDEDYQVINIIKREYYDPKQNKWIKLKNKIK